MSIHAEAENILSDENQLGSQRLRAMAFHSRTIEDVRAPEFWSAELTTRHFTFVAFGTTEESCKNAMERVLTVHAEQYLRAYGTIPAEWVRTNMNDVNINRRFMGEGYRDDMCLTGGR